MHKETLNHQKKEDINKIKQVAEECLALATELNMEHGKGLSLELLGYGKMLEFDTNYQHITEPNTIITPEQKDLIKNQYCELEPGLLEARQIAINYGDANLATRVFELLANVYRRSDQYEKEIGAIESAVKLSRTIPKVMALLDGYQRLINFLFDHHANNADAILKFHMHYWENYLWLKDQPTWERDKFILSHRIGLYKIAIYVGSIAGNPLNLGEQNPENDAVAKEAYDEAIYLSTVLRNWELLCAAHAHKALTVLPKLGVEEKRQLLSVLVTLEETYHPESEELREMIAMIRQQLSDSS